MLTRFIGICKRVVRSHSAVIVSSCVHFTIFSLVIVPNNENVCAIFGCNVISCVSCVCVPDILYLEIFGLERVSVQVVGK